MGGGVAVRRGWSGDGRGVRASETGLQGGGVLCREVVLVSRNDNLGKRNGVSYRV